MPSETVILTWEEITVDGTFEKYRIERKIEGDTSWTLVTEIFDIFQISYIDTIYDDNNLYYRVGMCTEEGNILWSSKFIELPNTNNILVPIEINSIQKAIDNKLVDSGDTILVEQGIYIENIVILGKDIIVKSIDGSDNTTISGKRRSNTIIINNSTIDGFHVVDGNANHKIGGGILINGSGVVKNCRITDNFAESKGGGIYMNGNGKIYNSIINSNFSQAGGGIYILDGKCEIINNTLFNNDVYLEGNCSGSILINNIIYKSYPDITVGDNVYIDSVSIEYSLLDYYVQNSSHTIITDPQFEDYILFKLQPSSPCIDAGHPDVKYNDIDGTRNNIGAYGGPMK
jgi:predicted outer membrane repeat protein